MRSPLKKTKTTRRIIANSNSGQMTICMAVLIPVGRAYLKTANSHVHVMPNFRPPLVRNSIAKGFPPFSFMSKLKAIPDIMSKMINALDTSIQMGIHKSRSFPECILAKKRW